MSKGLLPMAEIESEYMNGWTYAAILGLAREFGWTPAGTLSPPVGWKNADGTPAPELDWVGPWDGQWPGGYVTNDYQLVTDADAAAMAAALERATQEMPDGSDEERDWKTYVLRLVQFLRLSKGFRLG